MKRVSFVSLLALGAMGYSAVLVQGCGDDVKLCDNGACDAPLDGGTDVTTTDSPSNTDGPATDDGSSDGGGDETVPDAQADTAPPGCDPAKDPKDSLPCVANTYGLFVDASKPAGGTGTKASPFNTIGAAVAATGALKRIYVCEGTYAEAVKLDAAHDGVSIYGGWACADWSYSGNKPKVQAPTTANPPLRIDALTQAMTTEDLEFDAKPGDATNVSSIAAFVTGSKNVAFSRVKLVASTGLNGSDGVTGSNYTTVPQNDPTIKGKDASNDTGGGPRSCLLCTNGINSTGGAGGAGGAAPGDGSNGAPPIPGAVPPNDGAKGVAGASCTNGHHGADGLPAANASGALKVGALSTAGWAPAPGVAGIAGGVAQGAGGGGGGGCGGCGGAASTAPTGGGASIGLLIVDSAVTVTSSAVQTAKAGDGGAGKPGQVGQLGGISGASSPPGCNGNTGGTGGAGAASGGAAGGVSIGVLYKSATAPSVDVATKTATSLGGPGLLGAGGAANPGVGGVQAVVQDATTL